MWPKAGVPGVHIRWVTSSNLHESANKAPQTGQLKQQKFIVSHPGGLKSEIKVSAGLVSPEASLPGLQTAVSSWDLSPVLICVLTAFSYKRTSQTG